MCGSLARKAKTNVYLVLIRDQVVLQDLCDTVKEFDPKATVVACSRCEDALALLRRHSDLVLAFVEAGPERVLRLRIDAAIRERGGKLILLGDDAEMELDSVGDSASLWPVLVRPFNSRSVIKQITSTVRA
ncbi:hypothetical protein OEZ60_19840 [Defluviimonas sp. WL0024]|uniref:Response regulatory domain-containing protein n=1 Tax=Albidovulum salinarum TaxID=2984153 RepID=A0ABT2X8G9_9RHOB|nr:hypothetical protein [Defluviimonas sp. WL0024]MCU9850246.1 hypothetical protein [Defluviimonas sp. WL0024]